MKAKVELEKRIVAAVVYFYLSWDESVAVDKKTVEDYFLKLIKHKSGRRTIVKFLRSRKRSMSNIYEKQSVQNVIDTIALTYGEI